MLFDFRTLVDYLKNEKRLGDTYNKQFLQNMIQSEYKLFNTPYFDKIVDQYVNNEQSADYLISESNKWVIEQLDTVDDNFDWTDLTNLFSDSCYDDDLISEYIVRYSHKMTDKQYWYLIGQCYITTNLPHSDMDTVLGFINTDRANREYMMSEEDRKYFDNLPAEVIIYRGCSVKEIESGEFRISWTLDRSIAEYFAYEYINPNFETSLEKDKDQYNVIQKVVLKSELIAYFSDRNEFEILYIPNTN